MEKLQRVKTVLIFASGNGSNFEAIIKYFSNRNDIKFILISDNSDAYVLKSAEQLNIESYFIPFEDTYNFLLNRKFDLAVLAGYMRILPENILQLGIFINIHPSLLPDFKGKNAIKRTFESNQDYGGVTVHYVDKEVDSGEIISQIKVNIDKNMNLKEFEEKIHKTEHKIYPKIIENLLFKLNVLIYGSGAREHIIAQKISLSPLLNKLYLASPNDGFKCLGETIEYSNYEELAKTAKDKHINLLIVGPENPLSEGIVDKFQKYKIKVIGMNKYWAKLESSKLFAKKFMEKFLIPTAKYMVIDEVSQIDDIIKRFSFPIVIKADGLAGGKGVCISYFFEEAENIIKEYLNGKFKNASEKVLIEEYLEGREISLISLWDGKTLLPFIPAQDYKKLEDNDKGPNTGGMGSYAPVKTGKKINELLENYTAKLQTALTNAQADFTGIIYSGLMITNNDIKVLEFNVRFGDPEIQSLLSNIDNDILEIFSEMVDSKLENVRISWKNAISACLVLAAEGYPFDPITGNEIKNIAEAEKKYGVKVYFAGVKEKNEILYSNAGRVLSICKTSSNPFPDIYKAAELIDFKGKIYRKDIGNSL